MTFELSAEVAALRERTRELVNEHLLDGAADIDRTGVIPSAQLREAVALLASADAVAHAVVVEELATASPAVAAAAGLNVPKSGGGAEGLSGLRGLPAVEHVGDRAQLTLAAVAIGIGRAALEAALEDVRTGVTTASGEDKPQWVLADAATEIDAARLVTLQAAEAFSDDEQSRARVGMARLLATRAAQTAVDCALRIAGASALQEGALLERLARDVRAVSLLAGTEEDQRAVAAAGLLPPA
jgi:alkylation response protein AidB-like acyl-CoA dehydrogenase